MSRLTLPLLAFFVVSCSSANPEQIHVVGTIKKISPSYCGVLCIGGMVKVELEQRIANYNHNSVYLITACLSSDAKAGDKVDVVATLHTGKEKECYYQNVFIPTEAKDIALYKLSETETSKIR